MVEMLDHISFIIKQFPNYVRYFSKKKLTSEKIGIMVLQTHPSHYVINTPILLSIKNQFVPLRFHTFDFLHYEFRQVHLCKYILAYVPLPSVSFHKSYASYYPKESLYP